MNLEELAITTLKRAIKEKDSNFLISLIRPSILQKSKKGDYSFQSSKPKEDMVEVREIPNWVFRIFFGFSKNLSENKPENLITRESMVEIFGEEFANALDYSKVKDNSLTEIDILEKEDSIVAYTNGDISYYLVNEEKQSHILVDIGEHFFHVDRMRGSGWSFNENKKEDSPTLPGLFE